MDFAVRESTTISVSARRLAAALAAVVLVCAAPAATEFNLATAANWARVMLLGGGLLLVYVVWLALLPCRETLWSISCVFAVAAAGGVLIMAVILFSPRDRPLPLDLGEARTFAAAWSAFVALLLCAGGVLAGRLAAAIKHP
jgi:hypothetical protein